MNITGRFLIVLVTVVLLAGCRREGSKSSGAGVAAAGQPQSEALAALAALQSRMAQVELEQEKIRSDLAEAQNKLKRMAGIVAGRAGPVSNAAAVTGSALFGEIESLIAAKVDEKIGSQSEIETIFTQAVQEGMEEYEKRQEAEAQRRAEERRSEMERRREEREERRLNEIVEALALTDSETEQLKEARAGLREGLMEIFRVMREEGGYGRDQVRAAMEELWNGHKTVLTGFLSEEQVNAYMEMEGARMPFRFMGDRRRGRE